MADKPTEKTPPLVVANVSEVQKPRKDGKGDFHLWKCTVVNHPADRGSFNTFSDTCGGVLYELEKSKRPVVFELTPGNEFQGKTEYNIVKVFAEDGKEVLYEEEKKTRNTRGGGPPDWSMRTPEERAEERRSIEAQKALEYSIRTLEAVLPFTEGMNAEGAVQFVENTHPRFTALIRTAAESRGADSGSRSSGAGGQREHPQSQGQSALGRPGVNSAPAPSQVDGTAAAPSASADGETQRSAPAPESAGLPSPESAPVDSLLAVLDAKTGSRSKTVLAFKKHFGMPGTQENMTEERLDELVGDLS